MMKTILAIDSFKGCLTSMQAELAAEQGIISAYPDTEVVKIPVTDGGDGMLDVFCSLFDCERITVPCHDALMRRIDASFAVRKDGLCILETAQACGIHLLQTDELNPLRATTYGVGELMIAAIKHGCKDFLVGLGGSATSDCGLGMLKAFRKEYGEDWIQHPALNINVTLASDVKNPLYGTNGAAAVFGPQKGACATDIACLDRRAMTFARMSAAKMGFDQSGTEGAGAAGGLGYAFLQFLNARMESGADILLREARFRQLLHDADCVITGEGSADKQTLMGKIPQKVLETAHQERVPVHLIAGKISEADALLNAGFASTTCINAPDLPLEEALNADVAAKNIASTVQKIIADCQ
nr:glycerate kinase [Prevotella sp. HUN102]